MTREEAIEDAKRHVCHRSMSSGNPTNCVADKCAKWAHEPGNIEQFRALEKERQKRIDELSCRGFWEIVLGGPFDYVPVPFCFPIEPGWHCWAK